MIATRPRHSALAHQATASSTEVLPAGGAPASHLRATGFHDVSNERENPMITRTMRALAATASAVGLLAISACGTSGPSESSAEVGSDFETVVEEAKKEGTLTIYSAESPELLDVMGQAFKDEYGITVNYVRLANAAILQRYTAERNADTVEADVIQISDPIIFDQQPDWFTSLTDVPLPALDELDETFVHDKYADTSVFPSSIQYNTKTVPGGEPPTSWQDLTSPDYKGKILLVDPRATITSLGLLDMLRQEYGDGFLEKLGDQGLDFVDSASPGAQQVAAGVYPVNFPGSGGGQVAPLKQQNAPVDYTVLSPTVWSSNKLSISAGSAHPNAAALYVNFRLSRAGIELVCSTKPEIATPIDDDFDGCLSLPEDARPIDYSLSSDSATIAKIEELIGR